MSDALKKAADEIEIRNVIARLAILADEGDLAEYISLFTEDAHWEMRGKGPNGEAFPAKKGHADILAGAKERRAAGIQGPGTHSRHVLFQTAVKLTGDSATARSYMGLARNAQGKPDFAIFTTYSDEFRRTPNGWKLARRMIDPG